MTASHPIPSLPATDARVFTIHVCPKCGHYDADPILRREDAIPCFRCGTAAREAFDFSRITPSALSYWRQKVWKDAATPMKATLVVPIPSLPTCGVRHSKGETT